MNRVIVICFIVVSVLAIRLQWTDATLDDFVRYPSAEVKRSMEMEEFEKDGDMAAAKKRAATRQRRANEMDMPDILRRRRRSLTEAEDEEEDFYCSTEETAEMKKRDIPSDSYCAYKVTFRFSTMSDRVCSAGTKERLIQQMSKINAETNFQFDVEENLDGPEIEITCQPGKGNYAPVGYVKKPSKPRRVNLEQPGGTAYLSVIMHELLHVVGLRHGQQEPGAEEYIDVNYPCINEQYWSQYEQKPVKYEVGAARVTPSSMMFYNGKAFKKKELSCDTMISKHPSAMGISVFGAFKDISAVEIVKVQSICQQTCPHMDERGSLFGKDCTVLAYHPKISTLLAVSELKPLDGPATFDISVAAGFVKPIECNGSKFEVTKAEWHGIPYSTKCRKNGAAQLITVAEEKAQYLLYACDKEKAVERNLTVFDDDTRTLYVDASHVSNGVLSVQVTCNPNPK